MSSNWRLDFSVLFSVVHYVTAVLFASSFPEVKCLWRVMYLWTDRALNLDKQGGVVVLQGIANRFSKQNRGFFYHLNSTQAFHSILNNVLLLLFFLQLIAIAFLKRIHVATQLNSFYVQHCKTVTYPACENMMQKQCGMNMPIITSFWTCVDTCFAMKWLWSLD